MISHPMRERKTDPDICTWVFASLSVCAGWGGWRAGRVQLHRLLRRAGSHPSTAPLHRPDTRQLAHCSTCTSLHTCTLLNMIHIVSPYVGEVEDQFQINCVTLSSTLPTCTLLEHTPPLLCIVIRQGRTLPIVLCSARLCICTDCHSTLHPGGKMCGYLYHL